MQTSPLRLSAVVILVLIASLVGSDTARADPRRTNEPQTSTIRIRLKGPTLRVRCRGGDCVVSVQPDPAGGFAVSVTRIRNGVPFTFAKTVAVPTNIAIETGIGNDQVTVGNVSVPGFLRIGLGSGDDTLDVTGTSSAKKATIDGGAGDDTIRLAPGTIGGKFRLNGKAGNDDVAVTGGFFRDKAGFEGGQGTDAITMNSGPFTVTPVVHGFEQQ
jgi:hypothetical protein